MKKPGGIFEIPPGFYAVPDKNAMPGTDCPFPAAAPTQGRFTNRPCVGPYPAFSVTFSSTGLWSELAKPSSSVFTVSSATLGERMNPSMT